MSSVTFFLERGIRRLEELLDRLGLLRLGPALGLLGAVPALREPLAEVPRVVVDAELIADQSGDAGGGPQVRGEPQGGRALGEPGPDLGLLAGGEERLATGVRGSPQRLAAAGGVGPDPLADRFDVDAENGGDLVRRKPLGDPLNGQETTLGQGRTSGVWWDRDLLYNTTPHSASPTTCESVGSVTTGTLKPCDCH